ncbi:3'(2'),5'-bisphosphate nucleotidase CysQ [Aliamphritea spongicola]|uniref:3'(2'),5'-bisphosphate nucleotidase CysQ n=1 Tax=Aliamphritea spongicola TaxID=707589 RepID=UPI00196A6A52|nr:3'(2'),5'-bisphosphate nucleotidase CysQ [Aliamphritea spongicola]MBN3563812.1 3'(2'),5'-bisphosphate nucleotidase CysQ [Aliamphritea spongicola]
MQTDHLLEPLNTVARQAGAAIMAVYAEMLADNGFEADLKQDGSPVTRADQAAEDLILPVLAQVAPEITVISEENASSHSISAPQCFFLVDPLDGTKEFLKGDGKGSFTVNIALIENGVPVLGVVYAPALDRLFYGNENGAFEVSAAGTRRLQVRDIPADGAVAVASVSHRDQQTNEWLQQQQIEHTVAIGSSLKFCLLAAGEADVYPRFGPTMEWDTGAGDAVLRAAGGYVDLPEGGPFPYGKVEYRNGAFIAGGRFQMK